MEDKESKRIMIIAGEISGDLHGGALVKQLKLKDNTLEIYGIGGDKMKNAGMILNYHINKMAFLGFTEVVKHIPFIKRVQKNLVNIIKENKIKNVVLIDYPGFNLNFAKKLKKLKLNIIYYISPQVWAWGIGRIKKIKKLVDKMIVVFPFEKSFYDKSGVDVEFVGHPLIEQINDYNFLSREKLVEKFNLDKSKDILLILPGSREHEVEKILPECNKASEKLAAEYNLQVVIAGSSNISDEIYRKYTNNMIKIIRGNTYDLMKYAKLGIIKSGTSTLESAILGLPMVIVYKTGLITYLIGKRLIKVKNIGMANIIAGEEVVPELIQDEVNSKQIYIECKNIISENKVYDNIRKRLIAVKEKLGSAGASEKAADIIYNSLNET